MSKVEKKSASTTTAEKHGYEFGGPIGAVGVTFGLPFVVYLSAFLCNDVSGCPAPSVLQPSTLTLQKLKQETGWPEEGFAGLFDLRVTSYVLAYYLLSLVLQMVLPGTEVEGVKLASGGKLKYKFNAFPSALLILASLLGGTLVYGTSFSFWTFLWTNHLQIITANLLIALSFSIFVYIRSFSVPPPRSRNPASRELAAGGHSGNIVYDFFIGRELNPRVELPLPFLSEASRTIDIKVFCELRPGMLGWVILNLSSIMHQYSVYGSVSDSILLTTAFQSLYVFDALYMESAILTTIDVITDGFGFMLAFGDLVWLPFIYSLQTRYLAVFPVHLGLLGIAGVLLPQGVGYLIFRGANNEKNRFRTNPEDPQIKHLEYIETKSGSKLLVTGWWGRARHVNYLGDWIMAWSYCLPTGIAGYVIRNKTNWLTGTTTKEVVQGDARGWGMIITYFYIVYFAILLIHRERRDEEKCKRKYGADWDRYTKKVRSRIVPGIY